MKISIVVCTYNPKEIIFKEVLRNLSKLILPKEFEVEGIIVNNNSNNGFETNTYVLDFLEKVKHFRLISENKPGLTFARIKGIKDSKGDLLIFADDDNVLDEDYINKSLNIFKTNPLLGAINPNKISVKFEDNLDTKKMSKYKSYYQESNLIGTQLSMEHKWVPCIPFGTGLVILKEVCIEYVKKVKNGELNASDRLGPNLSSGGDTQMVYEALKLNKFVGRTDELSLVHFIAKEKSNFKYVARLNFELGKSNATINFESFPEYYNLSYKKVQNFYFFKVIVVNFVRFLFKKDKHRTILDFIYTTGKFKNINNHFRFNSVILNFTYKIMNLFL